MKKNTNISAPKLGMNRSTHGSQLKPTEYSFALNANNNTLSGERLNITNEPSNILAVVFPAGYVPIGYQYSNLLEKTFYFLLNPQTGYSSIGYVDNVTNYTHTEDALINCTGCYDDTLELGTPLEDITQMPYTQYNEMLNDLCNKDLNFQLNFPIKTIEIKTEKQKTIIYWTDGINPPRYLNIDDLAYYQYTGEVICGIDNTTPTCIDVEKLLIFPHHRIINLDADLEQTGGNLKIGIYEFYAAYCDALGNEITDYCTPTNPISVFDENNFIIEQPELDQQTNFALKIKANNLDTRFKYYKVVVKQITNVASAFSYFVEGIHPTTDDTIIYSSEAGKERFSPERLAQTKPNYETTEKLVASGNLLMQYGLTEKRTPNLQPVVNLFSSLLQWQTSVAKESLYKSAIATSKYKGYRRDEVQPFGIRFFYKNGGYTPVFPMVGRPSMFNENDILSEEDINLQSIQAYTPNCDQNGRNRRWQIYNTAFQTDTCYDIFDTGIPVEEETTRNCTIEDVATIPSESDISIILPSDYTNFKDYLNTYKDEVSNPSDPKYIAEIASYLSDDYSELHCEPVFQGNCSTPVLQPNPIVYVDEVVNEQITYIPKTSADYQRTSAPTFCNVFKINTSTGSYIHDISFENSYMDCDGSSRKKVYVRDSNFTNENCLYSVDVFNNNSLSAVSQGYFNNYYADSVLSNLLTSKDAFTTDADFNAKVHKGALWFKINRNNRSSLVFEITKNSVCTASDDIPYNTKLRYTFFTDCNATTPIDGNIIDTTSGELLVINDLSAYPTDYFFVAIDAPIKSEYVQLQPCDPTPPSPTNVLVYRVSPPCGCYSVFTRDIENSGATISWDSIKINKKETYVSTCSFYLPQVYDCEPSPYAKGEFSYWESTDNYSDNAELYDSSGLNIRETDLANLTSYDKTKFEEFFTTDLVDGIYTLDGDKTNFQCKPIRHFKFPDNRVAPFMLSADLPTFSDSYIFPLGVTLDSNVVIAMLEVAHYNNLLTSEELNQIEGYEIMRGDNSVSKSVLASGLAYDMYKYTEKGTDVLYANYPHNDLGTDLLHYTDSSRNGLIQHPYSGLSNNKYSFLSPDLFLSSQTIPTEVTLTGYELGNSRGFFSQVDKHPKWTILTVNAKTTATLLAVTEAVLEIAIKTAELTINGVGQSWFIAGVSSGTNAVGTSISSGALIAYISATAINGFTKVGQYRYEWLKIIRDLGQPKNFANYYVSEGFYNKIYPNFDDTQYIRGISAKKFLRDSKYQFKDEHNGEAIKINNLQREYSAFISLGDFNFTYDNYYRDFDNSSVDRSSNSRTIASDNDCSFDQVTRNVGSPFFTLKNYIPNQFGVVDSIKWLTTNYKRNLTDETTCDPIFGGTVSISRFTWKRKLPIFTSTSMGEPDKLPFNYSLNPNIGSPKYYVDYEIGEEASLGAVLFPDINSEYDLDCDTQSKFYKKEPSKFYLYYYGIANFLVESEINCNFRYGKKAPFDQFYPNAGDMVDWTQESRVSIKEPNTFYYNPIYSQSVSNTPYVTLDKTYSAQLFEQRRHQPNAVIYSDPDTGENDIVDPWLIYKPLNWHEFPKKYGKLIHLKNLESEQVLGRFENQMVLFRAIDTIQKQTNFTVTQVIGDSGVFGDRVLEFKATDLGFAGTQTTDMVSTPYGHYSVDAKRGKIFSLDANGKDLQPISDIIGGKESGMKSWFKENLPFKILKYFPNADIDNKFKGLGISIGWDAKYERVFFTKKDYIPKVEGVQLIDGDFYIEETKVDLTNPNIFEDVSWTIAYKPMDGVWVSYYSFTPNFYVGMNDYFQTYDVNLWSHLLTNQSYQVFNSVKYPFIIEAIIPNENANKLLESVKLELEAKRYQNKWDFAQDSNIGFNKVIIYNNTNNSGLLNLKLRKSLLDQAQYPKTNLDNSQDILYTSENDEHTFNYFYNRVINQGNNIPQFINDRNHINKTINPLAVNFNFKKNPLERLRGDYFYLRLIQDAESRYSLIFKDSYNTEQLS